MTNRTFFQSFFITLRGYTNEQHLPFCSSPRTGNKSNYGIDGVYYCDVSARDINTPNALSLDPLDHSRQKLFPVMTTAEGEALNQPRLVVIDSDLDKVCVCLGNGVWMDVCTGSVAPSEE